MRTEADDIPRVRLPHTGLRVPDTTMAVTRYRQRSGTVAFTATLMHGRDVVGALRNDGNGGPTCLTAAEPDQAAAEQYAGLCLTEEGDPVTSLEQLIEDLLVEHVLSVKVTEYAAAGRLPLRLMQHLVLGDDGQPSPVFPPRPTEQASAAMPGKQADWTAVATAVAEYMPTPGPCDWWQAWHRGRWQDLTDRPDGVRAGLYA